jgi:hypothetical protein
LMKVICQLSVVSGQLSVVVLSDNWQPITDC